MLEGGEDWKELWEDGAMCGRPEGGVGGRGEVRETGRRCRRPGGGAGDQGGAQKAFSLVL